MGKPAAEFDWEAEYQIEGVHGIDEQDPRDERSQFERDRDRIIHSVAFRRLQGKTQLFPAQWADPMRTRLTHSLEVAQIGRGIAKFVGVPGELVEAACLAHDLGHPPFGHVGEKALNELMLEAGGFDSNAQSYRVVNDLEDKKNDYPGLNLSRGVLLGMLKYPYERSGSMPPGQTPPPSAHLHNEAAGEWTATNRFLYDDQHDFARWMFAGTGVDLLPVSRRDESPPRTLPCAIVDWADDIAYAIHDLEDGLVTGMLDPERFTFDETLTAVDRYLRANAAPWSDGPVGQNEIFDDLYELKGQLRDAMQTRRRGQLRQVTRSYINELILSTRVVVRGEGASAFDFGLVVPAPRRLRTAIVKALTFEFVLKDARVVRYLYKGRQIIERLFQVYMEDPKIMDQSRDQLFDHRMRERLAEVADDPPRRQRIFADYLASMTEREATLLYQTMFDSSGGSPLA